MAQPFDSQPAPQQQFEWSQPATEELQRLWEARRADQEGRPCRGCSESQQQIVQKRSTGISSWLFIGFLLLSVFGSGLVIYNTFAGSKKPEPRPRTVRRPPPKRRAVSNSSASSSVSSVSRDPPASRQQDDERVDANSEASSAASRSD